MNYQVLHHTTTHSFYHHFILEPSELIQVLLPTFLLFAAVWSTPGLLHTPTRHAYLSPTLYSVSTFKRIPSLDAMAETRRKGANSKQQVNICSAKGLLNTQPKSDDAPLASEQEPVLTLATESNYSFILGTQVPYLTKATFSASTMS